MNHFIVSLGVLAMSISPLFSTPLPVVTTNCTQSAVLHTKTTDFQENELPLAKEIGDSLIQTLALYGAAAGLAAPQIGISRSVFVYSYNRDPKNLEIVINPSFTPVGTETVEGWEGCFSVPLKLAKVSRFEKIHVSYVTIQGESVEKTLSGFSAKVFQHECDHLEGIVTTCKKNAIIASFDNEKEMQEFMEDVKKEDAKRYISQ